MRVTGRRWLLGITATLGLIAIGWASWQAVRQSHPALQPNPAADLPIPEPHWGEMERVAPQHVRTFREQLDRAQAAAAASPDALARAYGELGEVYLAYDIPASAVPCFQNAARLERTDFRWPYLEAVAQLALLDTRAAAAAMSEAVNRQRQDPAVKVEHRVAALCFLGEAALRLNDLDEARSCFNEALRLSPNSVFALFKRGQLASQSGDSPAAIADFEFALSRSPDRKPKPVLLALGMEYAKAGRHEEAARLRSQAATSSDKTVMRYPDPLQAEVRALNQRPSAVQARAEAALSQGNPSAALVQLDAGLTLSPQSVELRLLRAQTLLQMSRSRDAVADLAAVTQAAPDNDEARVLLIQTLARVPDSAAARPAAVAWVEEQPDALRPRIVLAALDIQEGRFDVALQAYEEAGRRFPQEVAPPLGAGVALCGLGRYSAARERLDAACTALPDEPLLKHHLARLLVTCPDETVRDPRRGLTIVQELVSTQETPALQETLACALAASGQLDEARRLVSDLAQGGEPQLQARLRRIGEAFASGRPWTERWPFAEIAGERPGGGGSGAGGP